MKSFGNHEGTHDISNLVKYLGNVEFQKDDLEYFAKTLEISEQEVKEFIKKGFVQYLIDLGNKFQNKTYIIEKGLKDVNNTAFRYPNKQIQEQINKMTTNEFDQLKIDIRDLWRTVTCFFLIVRIDGGKRLFG